MKLLSLILMLSITGCAHIQVDKWDAVEVGEAVALTGLMVVDVIQTSQIVRNPDLYHEINPILGEHPTQGAVNLYFVLSLAFKLSIAHFLPHPWRKAWLGLWIFESATTVQNNSRIGLRP